MYACMYIYIYICIYVIVTIVIVIITTIIMLIINNDLQDALRPRDQQGEEAAADVRVLGNIASNYIYIYIYIYTLSHML